MWSDNGYTMPIEAGKYWLDNHFICAFTPDGELHKLYKYQVFDDLSIKISDYQSKKPNKTRFLSSDERNRWLASDPVGLYAEVLLCAQGEYALGVL